MPLTPLIKPDDPYPVLLAARSANLLIFFIPSTRTNQSSRAALAALADAMEAQLAGLVRLLRIDENHQSDVAQSFAVTKTPTFVLLRRGVELWRQEDFSEAPTLVELIRDKLR